jgi:Fe2+ or Zn2+ uptake regulation protein
MLQRQILEYVARRTEAAETAEGVTRVWLNRAPRVREIADVERALEELVDAGLMEKHTLPGAKTVYRRAQDPRA